MKKMRIFVAMITLGVLISMQFTQNVAAATQKSSFDNSKVYAKENVSVIEVSSVTFEYMDDPYTEESYSDPVVSMQYHGSMSGGSGMVSRENYNFYCATSKRIKYSPIQIFLKKERNTVCHWNFHVSLTSVAVSVGNPTAMYMKRISMGKSVAWLLRIRIMW